MSKAIKEIDRQIEILENELHNIYEVLERAFDTNNRKLIHSFADRLKVTSDSLKLLYKLKKHLLRN